MAATPQTIEFEISDPAELVAVMERLSEAGDGSGWVNIEPVLSDEEESRVPRRSGTAAWFSGRGPAVPMGTWMPPVSGAKPRAAQLGMAHGTGPNALTRLADAALPLPAGWVKRQDHAKHGIVADLPNGAAHEAVIEWVVGAAMVLSPDLPLGRRWRAVVHQSV